jgi:hypothetical protein
MKILLLWLGLIGCGVANGVICDHVQTPVSYFMIGAVCVCVFSLLMIHRRYTKNWCAYVDEKESNHPSVFRGSILLSLLAGVESVLVIHSDASYGFFIGCLTVFIASCVAAMREQTYA